MPPAILRKITMPKLGRNDPCYCGSGKKYKHCCLGKTPRVLDPIGPAHADEPILLIPLESPYADDGDDEVFQDLLDEAEATRPETPLDRAYDLAADAWDSLGRERVDLARRALAESPDCVDAYNVLAAEAATPDQAIVLYERALAVADRVLGADWWEVHPTRDWTEPIEVECALDARLGLARALGQLGRDDESVEILRAVIAFDPEDYDGVRDELLDALLRTDRDDEAMDLIDAYPGTISSNWPYARALLKYRRDGDSLWARRALVDALAYNPVVAPHILDIAPPPEMSVLPGLFDPDTDAADAARQLADTWQRTPGAMDWLTSIFEAGPDANLEFPRGGEGPALCQTPTDVVGFVHCPRCERKTKPRKRDVVVLIEPDQVIVVRLACRHCENCNVVSILQRSLQKGVDSLVRSRAIDLTGRDYLSVGVIDPAVVDQRPSGADEEYWINDHLLRWSEYIRLTPELDRLLGLDDLGAEDYFDAPDDSGVIDVPFSLRPR
jgi:tetratricopeptide (TPR) repeat protein